jgi:hypothetical protein
MFLRFIILFILFCPITAFAEDAIPFQNFEEFVQALEEMPKEEFSLKGKLTSADKISEWHAILKKADPKFFESWNSKLVGLPTIGFKTNERLWELRPQPLIRTEVGFILHEQYQPFASIEEFVQSYNQDAIDIFQGRVRVSSSKNLGKWMQAIAKQDQKAYHMIVNRAQVMRKIGYGNEDQFHYPEELTTGTKREVGLKRKPKSVLPKVETLDDFVTAYQSQSPEKFSAIFRDMTPAKKLELMRDLNKTHPEIYQAVTERLRSRTKTGFVFGENEPETILQKKSKRNAQTNDKLIDQGPRKIVKGFEVTPKGCDLNTLLGMLKSK